jgi:hypothetical protein
MLRLKLLNESRQLLMNLHDIDTEMDTEIDDAFKNLSLSNDISKPIKYSKH